MKRRRALGLMLIAGASVVAGTAGVLVYKATPINDGGLLGDSDYTFMLHFADAYFGDEASFEHGIRCNLVVESLDRWFATLDDLEARVVLAAIRLLNSPLGLGWGNSSFQSLTPSTRQAVLQRVERGEAHEALEEAVALLRGLLAIHAFDNVDVIQNLEFQGGCFSV